MEAISNKTDEKKMMIKKVVEEDGQHEKEYPYDEHIDNLESNINHQEKYWRKRNTLVNSERVEEGEEVKLNNQESLGRRSGEERNEESLKMDMDDKRMSEMKCEGSQINMEDVNPFDGERETNWNDKRNGNNGNRQQTNMNNNEKEENKEELYEEKSCENHYHNNNYNNKNNIYSKNNQIEENMHNDGMNKNAEQKLKIRPTYSVLVLPSDEQSDKLVEPLVKDDSSAMKRSHSLPSSLESDKRSSHEDTDDDVDEVLNVEIPLSRLHSSSTNQSPQTKQDTKMNLLIENDTSYYENGKNVKEDDDEEEDKKEYHHSRSYLRKTDEIKLVDEIVNQYPSESKDISTSTRNDESMNQPEIRHRNIQSSYCQKEHSPDYFHKQMIDVNHLHKNPRNANWEKNIEQNVSSPRIILTKETFPITTTTTTGTTTYSEFDNKRNETNHLLNNIDENLINQVRLRPKRTTFQNSNETYQSRKEKSENTMNNTIADTLRSTTRSLGISPIRSCLYSQPSPSRYSNYARVNDYSNRYTFCSNYYNTSPYRSPQFTPIHTRRTPSPPIINNRVHTFRSLIPEHILRHRTRPSTGISTGTSFTPKPTLIPSPQQYIPPSITKAVGAKGEYLHRTFERHRPASIYSRTLNSSMSNQTRMKKPSQPPISNMDRYRLVN
ncbi:hypothetical protein SNEBB_006635 [Seison nebaliae]|nr:hypothetical protein SNEBB_006635 [Seison nebaliae]